ncbi:hypothetical protein I2I11_02145 [Pontibacter sp. 172403-2]|uniref:hypothetical protein n=1 Tax=Pontibacter rufus TaxID=2791028 RepID=UPI0018AF568D|nr:hypothetical protein [Pontibacter sp. 172403-2]MBF9252084.1 hypothetical protein [Pontibacter sp. 172403-2]
MGKRQIRIFRKDIPERLPELLQRAVQVVLRSRVVLHGVLLKLTPGQLQLQDQRFGKHLVPVEEVEEIIYDVEAAW